MNDFYYRKLKVYHKALDVVTRVYRLTNQFPQQETFSLTNQLQRAAISVPSNIAEGMGRFSIKERIHFLEIANGSLLETMCQLEIAQQLGYISKEQFTEEETLISETAGMLIGLCKTLEIKNNNKSGEQRGVTG